VRLLADVDVAVEEGQAIAEFTGDDGTTSHRAHYVVIHQRQSDGSWLMHRDIWTAIPDGEPGAAGSDAAAAPGETG
jgi:ketosteroid isomerase-like protein